MYEKNWPYENNNWLTLNDDRCKTVNGVHIMECFTGVPPDNSKIAPYLTNTVYIHRDEIGQYILQEKKPVAMNIFWYFDAVDSLGNISFLFPEDSDKGGHVILLVGYDSQTRKFIFQNSWGANWGTNGYGTIPEDYIINYFELNEVFPYSTDISIQEKTEYIKGSLGVSAVLK